MNILVATMGLGLSLAQGNYIMSKTNCENGYEHITTVQECANAAISLGKVGGDFDVSDVNQNGDEKKTCLLNLSHGRTAVLLDGLREIGTIHQMTCSSHGFEGCFCKRKDEGNYIMSKTNCENDYEHITTVQECANAAISIGKVGGDFDVSDVNQNGDEKKTCLLNLSHGRTAVLLDGLREIGTIHQMTCSSHGFEGCFCKRKDEDKCASAHGVKACEMMDDCNWTRPQGAPKRVCIRHTCTSAQKRVNCEAVGCSWYPETRTCSAWHLAPPGAVHCDKGVVATHAQCEAAVKSVAKAAGAKPGRGMQVGWSDVCSNGGWDRVPLGCSAQSGGDWAAHFKTDGPAECSSPLYQLVCGPGPARRIVTVTIGGSGYNSKTVTTTYTGLVCPAWVDIRNWLGDATYPDKFEVSTSGSKVTVRRLDVRHGWGMHLQFKCTAAGERRRLGVEDELMAPGKNITELFAPENSTQPAAAVEGSLVAPEA